MGSFSASARIIAAASGVEDDRSTSASTAWPSLSHERSHSSLISRLTKGLTRQLSCSLRGCILARGGAEVSVGFVFFFAFIFVDFGLYYQCDYDIRCDRMQTESNILLALFCYVCYKRRSECVH